MLKQNKKMGLAALAFAALLAAPTLAQAKDDVAATVNGSTITKKEVMSVLKLNNVKDEEAPKLYPRVVDDLINQKLVAEATAKANIEQDPVFQQRMAQTKEQLIQNMFIEKYLKDKVTDKAVKAEYDKLKKENKGKTEVHARHILVKTEEEAKQVIKDLESGAKFEDLAKERSSDPSAKNGGDIGYFTKDELIPEFSAAAFDLKPGTYTKTPVKSQFGYHVIYVQDKRDRSVPDLKAVETQIRQKLGQEAVQKLVMDLRAKADIKRFDMDGKPVDGADAQKN